MDDAGDPSQIPATATRHDFIRAIIDADNDTGKYARRASRRFPSEPNGYLHIGHAKSICLNFGIAEDYGGTCTLRLDDTNPRKEEQGTSTRSWRTCAGSASTGAGRLPSDYFEQMFAWAETTIPEGQGVRLRPLGGPDPQSWHADAAGTSSPWRDAAPTPTRSLDLFRRMRAGSSRRLARPAGEDRHGVAQPQHARSGPLPDPPRRPSARGRQVVRLPDVRLCAPARGRDREDHALHLHPRVRGPSAALRLVHRRGRDPGAAAAADRVRAPQPGLHRPQQAQAPAARRRGARRGMGRSAHADDLRTAPARLHARVDPRLLRADRRRQARQPRGPDAPRERDPGRPQPAGAARDGGPAAPQGVLENYPEGQVERVEASTIPRTPRPGPASSPSRASSTSSRTT
jgi:hypothetical protein